MEQPNIFIKAGKILALYCYIPCKMPRTAMPPACCQLLAQFLQMPLHLFVLHITAFLSLHHSLQDSPCGLACFLFYYMGSVYSQATRLIRRKFFLRTIFSHYKYKSFFLLLRFRINLTTSTMVRISRIRMPAPILKAATAIRLGFFRIAPRLLSSSIFLRLWVLL